MAEILIQEGRILNPATSVDQVADILIEDGKIKKIGEIKPAPGMEIIEAKGKLVIPGLTDLHVHLRDMDEHFKETVATATLAALHGGVTHVLAMPNTKPRLDCKENIGKYKEIIAKDALISVDIAGAISKNLEGAELAELKDFPALGIHWITDDGFDFRNDAIMLQAYDLAAALGLRVMIHPERHDIAPDGVVNEGAASKKLGVPGQPNEKEWKAVARGIEMCRESGVPTHLTHVSTKESIDLIRKAKADKILVTCDVTPHHLALTEDAVLEMGTHAKVNPPLRTEADRRALIDAIKDGIVDAIATDHAPHRAEEKDRDLLNAPFGISGLETLLPATLTTLYHLEKMPLIRVIALMTSNPSGLIRAGTADNGIVEGGEANLVIVDLDAPRKVDRHLFKSKGKNSPFHNKTLKGWPIFTLVQGKVNAL
jgi:dihydroorotase